MRLIQYREKDGQRRVGWVTADGNGAKPLSSVATVYELAQRAIAAGGKLADQVKSLAGEASVDYAQLLASAQQSVLA